MENDIKCIDFIFTYCDGLFLHTSMYYTFYVCQNIYYFDQIYKFVAK